jgi:hypothetical protein
LKDTNPFNGAQNIFIFFMIKQSFNCRLVYSRPFRLSIISASAIPINAEFPIDSATVMYFVPVHPIRVREFFENIQGTMLPVA